MGLIKRIKRLWALSATESYVLSPFMQSVTVNAKPENITDATTDDPSQPATIITLDPDTITTTDDETDTSEQPRTD